MGKKSLEEATGLDKAGRIARAKRRQEAERIAQKEAARQQFASMMDVLAGAKKTYAEQPPAMIGALPSGDPKESQEEDP